MSNETSHTTEAVPAPRDASGGVLEQTPDDVLENSVDRYTPPVQEPDVVCTAGFKGGIGKSRIARELACLFQAVLTDFEWDFGGVTRGWGYFEEERVNAPLLDAFRTKKTPKPLSGAGRKPDLIPGHTDFERNQPPADVVATEVTRWAQDLNRRLVIDTHPGGSESTFGAMAASRVTVVPVVLGVDEMRALDGLLRNVADYPLLLIPYRVRRSPAAWALHELEKFQREYKVTIGPLVGEYSWIPDRRKRVPICASPPSKRTAPFVDEMRAVAEAVDNYGR